MPFGDVAHDVDVVLGLVGGENSTRSLSPLRDGGLRTTGILVEPDHVALEQIGALIDVGWLRVLLDRVLLLEDAAKAHEFGEAGCNLNAM